MKYPSPYGKEEDLAIENQSLKSALKYYKEKSKAWTTVFNCVITHEDPYDFDYCTVHDRTFQEGGMCDHAGLSEIDYLSDREMQQRGRAVRAESKLEQIHVLAEDTLRSAPASVPAADIICIVDEL